MINLHAGARPDERFHLSEGAPTIVSHFDWGWLRRTKWDCNPGTFVSWFLFGRGQFYHGDAKCDGTRTVMAWNGQLGDRVPETQYVLTTTPSEMHALRWRSNRPGPPVWNDMGGT